ncbi:MAG TPA: epoxide hydrolase [Candidatus Dormibacteraeota bacterium]|nr:epoxide hydrolase [Candidatus Dormibacteraeota bacterium]
MPVGGASKTGGRIRPLPFRLDVPEAVLDDLRARLDRVRWPDEAPGTGWSRGTDLAYLRRLVEHWRTGYDWREHERRFNRLSQFTVPIGGIDLHAVHEPGAGPDPLPLLLVHGWPGSVWEFHDLIPRLTDPAAFGGDPADACTVVAPSLPGYALSFRPGQPRLGITETAGVLATLMTGVLGHRRFAAQGGDWGAYMVTRLALDRPELLCGIHLNLLAMAGTPDPAAPTPEEARHLDEVQHWQREERAYFSIQGTKPQTLAYGLTDSPVGLLAWIVEKFRTWTDRGGGDEPAIHPDVILTNVMLYWVTGAINSSFWPYVDRLHGGWRIGADDRVRVPTGYAAFPREITRPPRSLAEQRYDIVHWTEMERGGHFAALEQPEALAADILAFLRPLRR